MWWLDIAARVVVILGLFFLFIMALAVYLDPDEPDEP